MEQITEKKLQQNEIRETCKKEHSPVDRCSSLLCCLAAASVVLARFSVAIQKVDGHNQKGYKCRYIRIPEGIPFTIPSL